MNASLKDWHIVRVSQIAGESENALATGPFGSSISSRFFQNHGVPVIRGSNLSTEIGARLVEEGLVFLSTEKAEEFRRSTAMRGDLVFTCWGTVNQVGLIDERSRYQKYVISNKQMKLSPDSRKADSLFLYYVFSSPEMSNRILAESIGSSVPGFNLGQLKSMTILLPPLSEQQAIAHILGTLDDKIELNRRMNKTLESIARAIFKYWFIDFEPIPGLGPHTEWEDSALGRIPKGWQVLRIHEVADRVGMGPFGSSIKVETFVKAGVPIISGQHLRGFMVEDNDFNFITLEHAERLKNSIVSRGDIVFTHAGNIGQVAFIPENSQFTNYIISQRQFFMRCNLDLVTPSFVTYYFQSPEGQHNLLANTSSSGVL